MTTKKADYIWSNGEMIRWEDAKVHVMSHALHYGTSVFEGIRCYDSHKGPVVFRHREHMQRLRDSAKIYRFPVSQSVDELMEACRAVLRKNNLTSAYIRPLVFVGDVGMGVNPPAGYTTDVIIAAELSQFAIEIFTRLAEKFIGRIAGVDPGSRFAGGTQRAAGKCGDC
jgi:branched-chain amino acid aminotransferase